MTKITSTLKRETSLLYWGDPLVIELEPKYMVIRRKGKHGGFRVSYEAAYELGARLSGRQTNKPVHPPKFGRRP